MRQYVASGIADGVAAFARNATTGGSPSSPTGRLHQRRRHRRRLHRRRPAGDRLRRHGQRRQEDACLGTRGTTGDTVVVLSRDR
jgi:hypothetical protein